MIKNLPLLLAMGVIGINLTFIASATNTPQFLEWFLRIAGVVLVIWSMIGLILHIGIQRLNKN